MNIKTILIVLGEPNSTFSEILFKYFCSKKFKKTKKKIVLVGCKSLLLNQMKKLNYKLSFNEISDIKFSKNNKINIINIDYNFKKSFNKITDKSNEYIKNCFDTSFKIIKKNKSVGFINGPISKKHFLKKKYPGVTEYIARKTNSKNEVMLIYNEKLSVSPITTHIPIKYVNKNINKKKIINNITKINNFFKNNLKKQPKFAVLGLNPHCETTDIISEEKVKIIPAINFLRKNNINIKGPFSADTFFSNKNIKKYDVVIGMYHDQVLIPIKTLFIFNAINLTIGLPFVRVTPDHGPNYDMLGKNKSDASSIFYAIKFFNKIS
tara:strand:+ start:2475 stop:3440 length:966 start_codon:yes stop_codon:yes gene_type:complete